MNTNIYDKEAFEIPDFIPLGIAMDYQVKWSVQRIIRDFVQNFYDSIGYEHFAEEFQYQWEITGAESFPAPCGRDERTIHIRMRTAGHTFSYEWLSHIGGSTKTGKSGYAGKYGEGFKIALLCLMKLGGNAVMSSGRWRLRPCEYTEEIEHQKVQMLGYRMEEREDDGFTTLDLYGIPASEKNKSYAGEALLEFFFPENELLGDAIEVTKDYALYGRSDMAVPCTECENIQGVFYYKYIARGRLPFPVVVHMPYVFCEFDSDRSRKILSEATVVDAIYRLAELLSPKASLWLLTQMKGQWKDTPKFRRNHIADLNTWYYVICQLVRNISSDSSQAGEFIKAYPPEKYAYIDRLSSDSGKNRLLRESKRWFEEKNKGKDQRCLINPIFRLLGIPSVFNEYMVKKELFYRKPNDKESRRVQLLKECTGILFSGWFSAAELPEIIVYAGEETAKKRSPVYEDYGIPARVETKAERTFSKEGKKRHLKYHVKEAVLDSGDLEAETKFEKTLLKYISACMHMYGTEFAWNG